MVPSLEREVVLVPERLADEDARALATALHADLTRIGDKWRLSRSVDLRKTLAEDDRAWLKAKVGETVARLDRLAARDAKTPVEAPFKALSTARARFDEPVSNTLDTGASRVLEVTPAARLFASLLRQSTEGVLGVAPGEAWVYSNAPAGLERSFPASAALDAYVTEQLRFSRRSEEAIARGEVPDRYRWAFPKRPFVVGSRTFQLYVDRRRAEPSFAISVFDPTGTLESNVLVGARSDDEEGGRPKRQPSTLGRVPMSPESLTAMERSQNGTPGFRAEWLDPVAHEPLDAGVRDALLLWGKAKGYPKVVACVPDALLDSLGPCIKRGVLDLDALTLALERAGCESLVQGSTLVVRPAHPLQEEAMRFDRRPLGTMYRKASQGRFELDDLLAFHAAYADDYDRGPLWRLEGGIRAAFSLPAPDSSLSHATLAILGNLSPAARQAVYDGGWAALDSPAFNNCLLALTAQTSGPLPEPPPGTRIVWSAPRLAGPATDLERTPTRLVARSGRRLEGGSGKTRTLVRRLPAPRTIALNPGESLHYDSSFILPSFAIGSSSDEYNRAKAYYRFLWIAERTTQFRFRFGEAAQIGPYNIGRRIDGSNVPVSLDAVPGLNP